MSTVAHKVYRIHPGIGIARLGNSTSNDYFIGPEVPDFRFAPAPNGNYRSPQGLLRRQGARFRIFEYTYGRPGDAEPLSVREITHREAEIRWTVQLANQKSYFGGSRFPNAPAPVSLTGPGQRAEVRGAVAGTPVQLGTLSTEESGRLVVLGGFGKSGPFRSDAGEPTGIHNPGWYDDTSDGPVRAAIKLRETGQEVAAEPAWVIASVPAYAAPVHCVVTLYDVAYSVAVEHLGERPPAAVSFLRDIYPVLFRTAMAQWVSSAARAGHGRDQRGDFLSPPIFRLLSDNSPTGEPFRARLGVFGKLRRPGGGGGNMPLLSGGLTLTKYQYKQFRKWSIGEFVPDWPQGRSPDDPPPHKPFHELAPQEQTLALDRAGLESTVGGSFNPGIEGGSILDDFRIYETPLRLRRLLPAGTLTASLSIPWQSDFNICVQSWWPSARPGHVTGNGVNFYRWVPWEEYGSGNRKMVERWWEFGFLKAGRDGSGAPIYVETERRLEIPTGIDLGEPPVPEEKLGTLAEAEAFAARLAAQAAPVPPGTP